MTIADLLDLARGAGWAITKTGSQHWKLASPDGVGLVYLSGTPSDVRSARNAAAHLRRHGLEVPREGGKKKNRA